MTKGHLILINDDTAAEMHSFYTCACNEIDTHGMRPKITTALKSEADGERSSRQIVIGMVRAMTTPQFPLMNCFFLIEAPSLEISG